MAAGTEACDGTERGIKRSYYNAVVIKGVGTVKCSPALYAKIYSVACHDKSNLCRDLFFAIDIL